MLDTSLRPIERTGGALRHVERRRATDVGRPDGLTACATALIDRLVHHATMIPPQGQELPATQAGRRHRTRCPGAVATPLRLSRETTHAGVHYSAPENGGLFRAP